MQAVKEILAANGINHADEMETGDRYRIEATGFMPLTIEKIGEHRVSVAHYYTQMGDLMSDPEIVFRIDGDDWIPVRYTQHPYIHQHDEDGLDEVAAFCKQWSHNLKTQGFVEAAKKQAASSDSHRVTA